MATLTIRNVSPETHEALRKRAASNNRSMEAEVRSILDDRVARPDFVSILRECAADVGGVELELPERQPPRPFVLE